MMMESFSILEVSQVQEGMDWQPAPHSSKVLETSSNVMNISTQVVEFEPTVETRKGCNSELLNIFQPEGVTWESSYDWKDNSETSYSESLQTLIDINDIIAKELCEQSSGAYAGSSTSQKTKQLPTAGKSVLMESFHDMTQNQVIVKYQILALRMQIFLPYVNDDGELVHYEYKIEEIETNSTTAAETSLPRNMISKRHRCMKNQKPVKKALNADSAAASKSKITEKATVTNDDKSGTKKIIEIPLTFVNDDGELVHYGYKIEEIEMDSTNAAETSCSRNMISKRYRSMKNQKPLKKALNAKSAAASKSKIAKKALVTNDDKSRTKKKIEIQQKNAETLVKIVPSVSSSGYSSDQYTKPTSSTMLVQESTQAATTESLGTAPIDVAAFLTLLGESLSIIGQHVTELEHPMSRNPVETVLLDSMLCALGPLLCLTAEVKEMNCSFQTTLEKILENLKYFMPGL